MKYEEDNNSSKSKSTSTGLIIAIAVAIIIIAAAVWFALSRFNAGSDLGDAVSDIKSDLGEIYDDTKSDINSFTSDIRSDYNSIVSDINSEYNSMSPSYNSTTSAEMTGDTAPTGDNVSSVPYGKNYSKPVEGEILKQFSDKELVYSKTFGDMRLHSGIDIACKNGTSVSACGSGKVVGIDENGMYGTVVSIDLGGGLTAKYASLTDLKVKVGSTVSAGDILGKAATVPAECNDQEHLHFEIYKNGIAVDPFEALDLAE